jgi:hypothetical protein
VGQDRRVPVVSDGYGQSGQRTVKSAAGGGRVRHGKRTTSVSFAPIASSLFTLLDPDERTLSLLKNSVNIYTYICMSIHPYKYIYVHFIFMSTSEKLS